MQQQYKCQKDFQSFHLTIIRHKIKKKHLNNNFTDDINSKTRHPIHRLKVDQIMINKKKQQ